MHSFAFYSTGKTIHPAHNAVLSLYFSQLKITRLLLIQEIEPYFGHFFNIDQFVKMCRIDAIFLLSLSL